MEKSLKPAYQCELFDLSTDADNLTIELVHIRALLDAIEDGFFGRRINDQKELIADDTARENLTALFYITSEHLEKVMENAESLRDCLNERLQEERAE